MGTTELKSKIYEAFRQFDAEEMTSSDAKMVVTFFYQLLQEESDRLTALETQNPTPETFAAQSKAHLDRFEINQQLRSRGLELEY